MKSTNELTNEFIKQHFLKINLDDINYDDIINNTKTMNSGTTKIITKVECNNGERIDVCGHMNDWRKEHHDYYKNGEIFWKEFFEELNNLINFLNK